MSEKIEQPLVGPVNVVDAEHHWPLDRPRFEYESHGVVNRAARIDSIEFVDRRRIAEQVDEYVDHALGIFIGDRRKHLLGPSEGGVPHRVERHARIEIEVIGKCTGDRPPHVGLAVRHTCTLEN